MLGRRFRLSHNATVVFPVLGRRAGSLLCTCCINIDGSRRQVSRPCPHRIPQSPSQLTPSRASSLSLAPGRAMTCATDRGMAPVVRGPANLASMIHGPHGFAVCRVLIGTAKSHLSVSRWNPLPVLDDRLPVGMLLASLLSPLVTLLPYYYLVISDIGPVLL